MDKNSIITIEEEEQEVTVNYHTNISCIKII